ncbi:MAG: hypothetical protein MUC38_03170 [Cyclobacteriaceae bacterium]|jgi:hypothetical protein|nr:hypothetical protein [Cyclobacteriaceae bacterium]
MRSVLPWVVVALVMLACGKQTNTAQPLYFDSLLYAQAHAYRVQPAGIEKYARVDDQTDTTWLAFDTGTLQREWDLFTPLNAFQKPAFADTYAVTVEKDPHSNLTVKRYRSMQEVPVPQVEFYYLATPTRLRAIRAVFEERNLFYSTQRHLRLSFAEHGGQPVITEYAVAGYQKMVLADSVQFSITGKIVWQ